MRIRREGGRENVQPSKRQVWYHQYHLDFIRLHRCSDPLQRLICSPHGSSQGPAHWDDLLILIFKLDALHPSPICCLSPLFAVP